VEVVPRSHLDGFAAGPGHKFIDAAGKPTIDKLGKRAGEPSVWIDAVQLHGLCRPPDYAERLRHIRLEVNLWSYQRTASAIREWLSDLERRHAAGWQKQGRPKWPLSPKSARAAYT
jgi:hypothetical protein